MATLVEQQETLLRELQRRCQTLEAERQANVEATQWTLHANQVSLLQLKETQADMLQQLKETKAERVVSAPQHLERKNEELARLRTQLDRQRNRNAMHRQRLDQLHDKLKDLELASAKPCTEDSPEIRSMRAIEGKLDQAIMELNEANAVRTTYEQIAERLKGERIGMYRHLEALDANLKEERQQHEILLGVCHDAAHANELAQAELDRLSKSLEADRGRRGDEVREKQTVIRQWLLNEKRLREAAASQEAAARSAAAAAAAPPALNSSRDSSEGELFEEALRRLKEVTGVSDANEIVQHFLTQSQTYEQLLTLAQGHQKKLQQLQEKKRLYSQMLEERKFAAVSSGVVLGGLDSPAAAEARVTAAKQQLQRQQQTFQKSQQLLSELQMGVGSLTNKLVSARVKLPWMPILHPKASLPETFAFCCAATKALAEAAPPPQHVEATAAGETTEDQEQQQPKETGAEVTQQTPTRVISLEAPAAAPLDPAAAAAPGSAAAAAQESAAAAAAALEPAAETPEEAEP